jgi:autotransporter-associated beta strand protein
VARFTSDNDIPGLVAKQAEIDFYGSGFDITGNTFEVGTGGFFGDAAIKAFNSTGQNQLDLNLIASECPFNILSADSTLNVHGELNFTNNVILTKFGDGTLNLSGVNSLETAFLEQGTLVVSNDQALGTGLLSFEGGTLQSGAAPGARITLANNFNVYGSYTHISGSRNLTLTGTGHILTAAFDTLATLTVANTQDDNPADGQVEFDGILYGPGSLTKTGNGTVTLSGMNANTYEGTTTVNQGSLVLNKPANVTAVAGPLVIGDGVDHGADNAVVKLGADNQIAAMQPVTINDFGLLKLAGHNQGTGSVQGSGASNVQTGDPPTWRVGFNNLSTAFAGVVSGPGSVVKVGTGTWTLTGANTYTGGTTINAGTLLVNGAGAIGAVTVNAGGTLGGTGTTGPVTLSAGSVVSPGGTAPGIERVQNLSFAPGSSFVVRLNGPVAGTGYDQLDVTGSVNLNGATLNASLGFSPALHDRFLIIKNDGPGPVIGTFAGLPQGSSVLIGGTTFRIYYDGGAGNDVELTRNVRPTVTAPGAQTAFQNVDLALGGISVTDPDDANLTVTLQVSHGTLTLGTVAGLTVGATARLR